LVNMPGYQVLPHAEITLDDQATDVARLSIRAQSLALGYVHTPAAPRFSALRPVFQSDDIGHFDWSGRLHLTGRHSQMIISGGENVFPAEVEAAILATGLVSDVCVVGLPDAVWGEAIAAAYVPVSPLLTPDEIATAIASNLSPYKCPKFWQAYTHLSRNAQGKLNHLALVEQLAQRQRNDKWESVSPPLSR
jgi:o-succinylbenzoate---CoA ligase